jgi:hypothetical protein
MAKLKRAGCDRGQSVLYGGMRLLRRAKERGRVYSWSSVLFFLFQLSGCLFPQPALQGPPLARSHDSGSKHAKLPGRPWQPEILQL